jgi:methyl-accepting chemotaxis protein
LYFALSELFNDKIKHLNRYKNTMNKLSISAKLFLSIGVTAAIIIVIGVMGVLDLRKINNSLEIIYQDDVIPITQLKKLADAYSLNVIDATNKLRNGNITWEQGAGAINSAQRLIDSTWNLYSKVPKNDQDTALFHKTDSLLKATRPLIKELVDIVQRKDTAGLDFYVIYNLYSNIEPIFIQIQKLLATEMAGAQDMYVSGNQRYRSASFIFLIFVLGGIGVSLYISWLIINSIRKSISEANKVIAQLTKGDLTTKIKIHSNDEIGIMLTNMQGMVEKLLETLTAVSENAEMLIKASARMQTESHQVSSSANQSAASIEELSSSMEEMASGIQHNTDNAKQTEKISLETVKNIERVGEASRNSLHLINDIAQKITVINDIAFQTNLLSLNAAVEAARAGVHGKGFAVVASEVKRLAEHSKEAASEIVNLAKIGLNATADSEKLIELVIPEIRRTASLIQEIASSSDEQNIGAEQVNTAIQSLNQATQENANIAQDMAQNSSELLTFAEYLNKAIAFFKIK